MISIYFIIKLNTSDPSGSAVFFITDNYLLLTKRVSINQK